MQSDSAEMQAEFDKLKKKLVGALDEFEVYIERHGAKVDHQASMDRDAREASASELIKAHAYIDELEAQIKGLKDENRSFMSVSTIVSLTNENAKLKQTLGVMERSMFRRASEAAPKAAVAGADTPKAAVVADTPKAAAVVDVAVADTPKAAAVVDVAVADTPKAAAVADTPKAAAVADTPKADLAPPPIAAKLAAFCETVNEPESGSVNESSSVDETNYYEKTIKGKLYYVDDEGIIYRDADGEVGDVVGRYVSNNGKKKVQWD